MYESLIYVLSLNRRLKIGLFKAILEDIHPSVFLSIQFPPEYTSYEEFIDIVKEEGKEYDNNDEAAEAYLQYLNIIGINNVQHIYWGKSECDFWLETIRMFEQQNDIIIDDIRRTKILGFVMAFIKYELN